VGKYLYALLVNQSGMIRLNHALNANLANHIGMERLAPNATLDKFKIM